MKQDKRLTNTKEKLFEAALDLFAARGFAATSIRAIVKQVGISTAAFYNHFASKDALLQAVYDFYREKFIDVQPVKNADYAGLLDKLGPAGFLTKLTDRFRIAIENPVLEKLGKIISLEKDKNAIAAEISFKDRRKLIEGMEEFFVLIQQKGYLKGKDARLLGQMFGYIQLGIIADNIYYRYIKKQGADEIIKRQNRLLSRFLSELIAS